MLRPAYCFVRPFGSFDPMELINLVVEAALATGFVGYLANRAWRWWRRPRLTICYDPNREPKGQSRRGFTYDYAGVTSVAEYVATVRNEGRTAARAVEATAELIDWWDGDEWREGKPMYSPALLVWSGSHETRTHIPPDGAERDLAVFVAGPLEGRPCLHLAMQSVYTSPSPPVQMIGPRRTRIRIEVTSEEGAIAACDLEVDWDPSSPLELAVEGDCLHSSC